jgi:SsrA-binding protein
LTDEGTKVVATNRKAAHDYFLEDRMEAGIVLQGSEIKSVRAGRVSLKEAYVRIEDGEAWLVNAHIAPYDPASTQNHDPRRKRKLLLHRRQIRRAFENLKQRGYTLVPTKLYLKRGRAKLEVALAKGKRQYDKRRALAKREAAREIERALSPKPRR